jgi:hypothetical protein
MPLRGGEKMPHRTLLEGTLFPNGTGNVEKLTNVSVEYSAESRPQSITFWPEKRSLEGAYWANDGNHRATMPSGQVYAALGK